MLSLPHKINDKDLCLSIIRPTQKDAKTFFNLVHRNRNFLSAYFRPMVSEVTTEDSALSYLKNDKYPYRYFICRQDIPIGEIYTYNFPDNSTTVGYWIDKQYTRQGIMTKALNLMEKTLFESGCQVIRLNISSVNTPSLRLALKNGYIEQYSDLSIDISRCFEKTKKMYFAQSQNKRPHRICSHYGNATEQMTQIRLNSMNTMQRG